MRPQVKWRRSFRFAYEGVKYALSTQRNMKFHFFAALVVLTLALFFRLTKYDVLFILLAVTLMIVTELINTAVEKAVDLAMPDIHPLAKIAKDVAAASVLVSAAFAAVTGMIVFYEPVEQMFLKAKQAEGTGFTAGMVWSLLTLIMLTVIVVETRFSRKGKLGEAQPAHVAGFRRRHLDRFPDAIRAGGTTWFFSGLHAGGSSL
ncbi:diacylglycerol kinase family protein [Paenibacillus sp. P25]|nr:diacylglycerol kinase family protein [Paenibacillus sp. P25]